MTMPSAIETPHPKKFAWLDWLRFLAAFMVVLGHTRFQHFAFYDQMQIPGKGAWSQVLFLIPRFANEAVTMFFVLSGFLVGGRCIERVLQKRFDPRGYAIDRVTRIWLPLVPTVLITWLVTWIRNEEIWWAEGIGNLASLQGIFVEPMTNNESLWTLSYEIWFYVVALAAALVIAGTGRWGRMAALLGLAISLAVFLRLQVCYLFIWIVGALAYFPSREPRRWGVLAAGAVMVLAGTLLSAFGTDVRSLDLSWLTPFIPPREISLMLLGLGVSFALPSLVVTFPKTNLLGKFEDWGGALAASSYSLYLIHRPILKLWGHWEGGDQIYSRLDGFSILMFAVKIASCLLGGWLFYLAFEKHTAWLRRKLHPKN